jgi:glucose/arabinose dehydrogenase
MNRSRLVPPKRSREGGSALVGLAVAIAAIAAILATITAVEAQAPRSSPPPPPLPQTFFSGEVPIRVIPVARGLSHPWSLAFLPDGGMLVTERDGRLRIIRNGVLDPTPIAGVPAVFARVLGGLLDVALHPAFAQNRFVYLSYSKQATTICPRPRSCAFDGTALTDVKIFVANTWSNRTRITAAHRVDRSGFLFLTVANGIAARAERQRSRRKVNRSCDDGACPGQPVRRPCRISAGISRSVTAVRRTRDESGDRRSLGEQHSPLGGDESTRHGAATTAGRW